MSNHFDKSAQSNGLTIKYLINLLNDQTSLKINRQQYLIDSFPTLKVKSNLTYDNILACLMIAYQNVSYNINETDLRIDIGFDLIKAEKNILKEKIRNSAFDPAKKKKYIDAISTLVNPTNERCLTKVILKHFLCFFVVFVISRRRCSCIRDILLNLVEKSVVFVTRNVVVSI